MNFASIPLLRAALALICGAQLAAGGDGAPLRRISEIREMPREEAAGKLPVRVRGVVTWVGGGDSFTIQDGSAGIWISTGQALDSALLPEEFIGVAQGLRAGLEVEIEGLTDPGGYAPLIVPTAVRVHGGKPLPPATPAIPARFFSGADDCQRIEIRGVVQEFAPWEGGVTLLMDANPGRFSAKVTYAVAPDPAALVDAEVSLRGVAATLFNSRGEVTGPRMLASVAGDLTVVTPPPPLGAVPKVALDSLQPFRPVPLGPHRVRVEGTVTYSREGEFFYLQEGESVVRVETNSDLPLAPGDRVEALGFVDMARFVGTLTDAKVRKTGIGPIPRPVPIAPEEILAINERAVKAGQAAVPHDFDGHLIRCRARLLAVQTEPDGKGPLSLLLERNAGPAAGTLIFRALADHAKMKSLENLQPGSVLLVTGLVQLDYAPTDQPSQMVRTVPATLDLILRGADDVIVVREPSWWTATHLAAVLAAVVLALGAALVWSLQLKRQVRRKTRLLAREIHARHDASIEFQATLRERTRLAANLHDTLLQTISGLGFQIEACESEMTPRAEGGAPGHLEVARRMADHAATELRNSVWALRSLPLDGMELPEALESIARRIGAGRATEIEVSSVGDLARVPDFIAGNLLLFVQEALQNALKHGAPDRISIEVRQTEAPARIVLSVSDDGSGFVAGDQAGVAQGHFGLQGMRERIERLDGIFTIRSSPGAGTQVHAAVPLRHYDEEMAERPIDRKSRSA